ncbi:unnamed protein product [Rotaria sp. Silwood2]|nr:unnamed protein product [Rotaria sp. Silwood2]CAF2956033.1 unnamed protein product [Rotaria sp. Silwood2]CAF3326490.1 unnamed protein product [Rotaria sp. Silwood2]
MSTRFHPICSSWFVSDDWINLLFDPDISYFFQLDFRSSATGQFQMLSSLCSFVKQSVRDSIDDFLSDTFFSPQLVTQQLMDAQVQSETLFLRTSTVNSVRQVLSFIRSATHNNQLQSALQTSKSLSIIVRSDGTAVINAMSSIFFDHNATLCSCGITSTCSSSSGIFNMWTYVNNGNFTLPILPVVNVTGFVTGCYAIEALLQSTLDCFFNRTCLEIVLAFFSFHNITTINTLNIAQTRFSPRTTIETILNDLFIEQWNTMSSFEDYFVKCAPFACTYSSTQQNNFLYILTKLLGLYGGLTVFLRICVPFIVAWWMSRINAPTESDQCKVHYIILSTVNNHF